MVSSVDPMTRKGHATRQRLLGAARELAISQQGSVEVSSVAAAAGVVPSLVHRYFGSKAGLLSAVVDDFYDRFDREVLDLDLTDLGDWATREHRRLEAGVRFHYQEPFVAVLYGPLAREPEVARREADRSAAVVRRAARSIRAAQRAGELPLGIDPELAGAAMFGAMRLVMVEAMTRAQRPRALRIVELLWRQVAASVALEGAELFSASQ